MQASVEREFMTMGTGVSVAIVDYGMGNLFSVQQACDKIGLSTKIATLPDEVLAADGVILPGVGAFGDAVSNLQKQGLDTALKESAARGTPLVGVCLGMQLLLTESDEFGHHRGLDIVKGQVKRLNKHPDSGEKLAIPHVGWSGISSRGTKPVNGAGLTTTQWEGTPLEGLEDGEAMYFVHTFQCQPEDPAVVLSYTDYGPNRFCSAFARGNVFGCQFHPERSGPKGLQVYQNIARLIENTAQPMKVNHV